MAEGGSGTGTEAPEARQIVIMRIIDAPREQVFDAFTDRQTIDAWWGPDGFTNTAHGMDVRPGGVWRHTMRGPDGTTYPNAGRALPGPGR